MIEHPLAYNLKRLVFMFWVSPERWDEIVKGKTMDKILRN